MRLRALLDTNVCLIADVIKTATELAGLRGYQRIVLEYTDLCRLHGSRHNVGVFVISESNVLPDAISKVIDCLYRK